MFRVFLIDYDGKFIELDVEELDFGLDFSIADLQNLSIRTGSRSKEIVFKGTEKNNNAFGWIYRIGRDSNLDLPNKLFFNYNSFRPVDCLIYKDTSLVFRGSLRLLEILRQRGVTYYSCVVTDAVIDFMKFIQERTLTDLDLNDLKHNYDIGNVIDSWDTRTQRWDGNAFVYEPFELGNGYVYPYLDYGSTQSFDNQVDLYNFRPALYVKEIFDRIFDQDELQGFTWELKADPDTTQEFNSLIVPNNQEVMKSLPIQYGLTYSRTSGDVWFVKANFTYAWVSGQGLWSVGTKYWLNMNTEVYDPSNTTFFPFQGYDLPSNRAIRRTVTTIETDGIINVQYDIDLAYSGATGRQAVNIALIERKKTNANWGVNYVYGYDEIATKRIGVFNSSQGTISGAEDLVIPKREFKFDTEWAVVIEIIGSARGGLVSATASFHIPATSNSIVVTSKFNTDIVPVLPEQVKQYDFIKSIMLAFNMYAYVEKERPKHIIFQTYDQFYALFNPAIIKTVALDWTSKLIYNEDFKKIMNLTIPKSYVYTYKEDRDFINVDYKESFNDVYSTLRFKDIYGVQDEKKVEVIFGSSPMVRADERYHTLIRYDDDEQIKPVASQIRLLYYNGVQSCSDYAFVYDGNVGPVIINFYGEAAEYYRNGLTFSRSLQWSLPKKLYFPVDTYIPTLPNLYSTFHINQITELTDANLFTLDCKFILNDVDISNFDFRTPIYISVGNSDIGNSYFKVIKISWKDNKTPASVLLQAVVVTQSTNEIPTTTTSTTTTTTTSPEPPPRPDFICVTINGIPRTYDYLAGQLGFIEAWYNADADIAVGRLSGGTWEIREDASDTYILAFESPDTDLRPQQVSPWFCVRTPACPDEVSIVAGPCPTSTTTSTTTTTTSQASTTTTTTTSTTSTTTTEASTTTTTTTSTTSTTTTEASTTTTTTTSTTSTTTTESLATEYFAYQFADVPLTSDLTYDDTNSYYYISGNTTPGRIVFYTEGEINPGPFEKTNDSLASRLAIHESSGDIYFGRSITTGIVRCIGGNFANQEIISVSLSPTPVNTIFYGFDIDQTNNVLYYTLLDDKIYKINLGIGNSASSIAATVSGTLFKLAVNQTNSDVYALAAYRDIYKVDIAGNTYSLIAGITGSIDIAHKENNNILYTVVSDISASPVVTPGIYAMTSTGSNITKIEFCGTWSSVNNYPKWLHIESDNNNDNLFVSSRSNNVGTYSQYNLKLVPCNQTTTTSTTTTTTTEATTTTSTTTETTTEATTTTTSTTTSTTTLGLCSTYTPVIQEGWTYSSDLSYYKWTSATQNNFGKLYSQELFPGASMSFKLIKNIGPDNSSILFIGLEEDASTLNDPYNLPSYEGIDYSLYFQSSPSDPTGVFGVFVNNGSFGIGSWAETDIFNIHWNGTQVRMYRNGNSLYSSGLYPYTGPSTHLIFLAKTTQVEITNFTLSYPCEGTTTTTTTTSTTTTTTTQASTTTTTTTSTTSTTTETTTEGTTSTTTETTTEGTTSTTTETTTEGTTSTTTETTTEGTTSTTTETTTEGTTSTTTETTTEGTTSTTTTTTTVVCYEWTATNNTANQEAVFWYDCCTGMELSEFLDPQTQTVVCARQMPTGNVTITGGTFVCEPECTTTTSTTTETTTAGTTSTTTTTTTAGTTSTTTSTTTTGSTTTTTTVCCYYPLYFGETLAEACINQTNAEFLVNGYFNCDDEPLAIGEFIYTDCSLETGLPNGFYWYDASTVYQITDQETAGQIWTISACPSGCIEYSVFNNKFDNSITITWYDCAGSQQTQVIAERTSFNFCANTGLGAINVPADGTLSSVGPCNTTTGNPS